MTAEEQAAQLYKRFRLSKMFVLDDVKSCCYAAIQLMSEEPGLTPDRKLFWQQVKKQIDRITYNNIPK